MNDFTKKTSEELKRELLEKRSALRGFRFDFSGSKNKNVKEGRALRADIARINTELSRRAKEETEASA
jgi:ribosomal protein L29